MEKINFKMRLLGLLFVFLVPVSGVGHSNLCYASHNGLLQNYHFPSEINLIAGKSIEADLRVTVKNTGDERWTACRVQNWPIDEYYPSYRIRILAKSWNPTSVHTFSMMYHINPGLTDTSTNMIGSLPDEVGDYSFTMECEYNVSECSDSYEPMKNTPVIIRFKIVSFGSITGRITDSKRKPLSGQEVFAHADSNRTILLGVDTTDSNGNYTLNRIQAGTTYVSTEMDGTIIWYDGGVGTEKRTEAVEVIVVAGETNKKINIGVAWYFMPWMPLLLPDD